MLVFDLYVPYFLHTFIPHTFNLYIHSQSGMYGRLHPNHVVIVAGTPQRMKRTDQTQQFDAKKIIFHHEYSPLRAVNDIGLIKIKGQIVENAFAQVVPLTDSQPEAGLQCTVLGWGALLNVSYHNNNHHT